MNAARRRMTCNLQCNLPWRFPPSEGFCSGILTAHVTDERRCGIVIFARKPSNCNLVKHRTPVAFLERSLVLAANAPTHGRETDAA